jgi:hypothetical protein
MSSDKELMFYYKLRLLRKLEYAENKQNKLANEKYQDSEILFYNKLKLLRKQAREEQNKAEQDKIAEEEKRKHKAQQFYIKIRGNLK